MEHDSPGNCSQKLALLLEDFIKVVAFKTCQVCIKITWNVWHKDDNLEANKKIKPHYRLLWSFIQNKTEISFDSSAEDLKEYT